MDLATSLRTQITSQNLPYPSPSLLAILISTRSPPPPLPSLVATAKTRLLACDLTTSELIDPAQLPSFPAEILPPAGANAQEVPLRQNICVQVLDIENLTSSRWEQIEELEAIERGERTRGRQVIRVTGEEDEDDARGVASAVPARPSAGAGAGTAGKNATHRLVVQDRSGNRVYAVELLRMPGLGIATMSIGCKLVLRAGCIVARGTVLLTPETCLVLGGKIESWHDVWVAGRMARLKETVGAGSTSA
ncbi:hypothetical protein E4U32_002091 [Claviceps aff. humidiphila group G2b]|nr:hypothetical protein E4U32_002091 [Claviceps aff. humidiphila group G2b]